jgi:hypothetical protein
MAWLWLISVGVTDIQFPVWRQDGYGAWTLPGRFEIGRGGIRQVHEGLLTLLEQDRIDFPGGRLPSALGREDSRGLKLDFLHIDGDFTASLDARPDGDGSVPYRISSHAGAIPNAHESRLPLYCPKVAELLDAARLTFGTEPVTVVVLNTRRNASFPDTPDEPIASGPLVARFLADRLGLRWLDQAGRIPVALESNIGTWVDVLTGDEAMEDGVAQDRVVARLVELIRRWTPGADSKVAVTTAGGMPPLKPIFERVPATCLGQSAVRLLEKPEQRSPAAVTALDYGVRIAEREALRFHCVEALRQGDYAGAYGLAHRFRQEPWAGKVRERLGPLLELPGGPLRIDGQGLGGCALNACQVEIRLCMDDAAGALMRMARFLESSTWALIQQDRRIQEYGLAVDREYERLTGDLSQDNPLLVRGLVRTGNHGHYNVQGLTWDWPRWLTEDGGGQPVEARNLQTLLDGYSGELRKYRNRLAHGSNLAIDVSAIKRRMGDSGLVAGFGLPFGRNFLALPEVGNLLSGLTGFDLAQSVGGQLAQLLNDVIEAYHGQA